MFCDLVTEQFQTPPPEKGTTTPGSSPTPFHFLHPAPQPLPATDLFSVPVDLTPGHFMSPGVPRYVAFCVWYLPLGVMSSHAICAVARVRPSRLVGAKAPRVVGTRCVCGRRPQPVDIGLAPRTSPDSLVLPPNADSSPGPGRADCRLCLETREGGFMVCFSLHVCLVFVQPLFAHPRNGHQRLCPPDSALPAVLGHPTLLEFECESFASRKGRCQAVVFPVPHFSFDFSHFLLWFLFSVCC